MKDSIDYGDYNVNTLLSVSKSKFLSIKNMWELGLFNIDGINTNYNFKKCTNPIGSFARLKEKSKGKDTTTGHWEIAGIETKKPFPTYPNGFPEPIIQEFTKLTGKKVLCNRPYSGTEVIKDYGPLHIKTGDLIVYTSADSVFQIAAHEDIVPLKNLYAYCQVARNLLAGKNNVGRVIARPFTGDSPNFIRTRNRHDFSLTPPTPNLLATLKENNKDVIAVGKINDIFAGCGITQSYKTKSNDEGIEKTIELTQKDFNGLCFVNLVDFDMLYGHRNDIDGYAKALTQFDDKLPKIVENLKENDILIITADHGCDPGYKFSTDHSREYVPFLIFGKKIKSGVNLGTRKTFSDIGATILDYFCIKKNISGISMLKKLIKDKEI